MAVGVVPAVKASLVRENPSLYSPPMEPVLVEVPEYPFLMIDGSGDPNHSAEFAGAIGALYSLAYPIKFALVKERGLDYTVMPLEGLWWSDCGADFLPATTGEWLWTIMIRLPFEVTGAMVVAEAEKAAAKKPGLPIRRVRFEHFAEGRSAQVMHRGPYSEEHPVIAHLRDFIREQGLVAHGRHHEIYLSNPNLTAPARMKTVLRQPVAAAPPA